MEFGRVEYICLEQKNGKGSSPRVLSLTLVGQGDEDLLFKKGLKALRQKRIMRLTEEAEEQGCLLGYEDLSALLLTSLATLKRDISEIEKNGIRVSLKGRRNNGNGKKTVEVELATIVAGVKDAVTRASGDRAE
ncbi:MAG: DUF1670 domain-containing protein [Nitrospirae bacterium]|nr:DUF1670 domain-containing protein [Nitrospirota bacterium]